MMGCFDRLVDEVEHLTGETPKFEDDSDVFEADVSIMVIEDDVRYLAVPMPPSLTSDTVDDILNHVDAEWNGNWVNVKA